MTNTRMVVFLWLVLLSMRLSAHIDAAIEMDLVGNRKVIVLFDAYEGYSIEHNNINAALLTAMIKKMARKQSAERIDFSYEDPAVYDLNKQLINVITPRIGNTDEVSDNEFFSVLPTPNAPGSYAVIKFKKPKKLTTLLAGSLTRVLALAPGWPENLTIRSNDPRHEHYLALVKGKEWLNTYQKNIQVKHLITASPLLAAKKLLFKIDKNLTLPQQEKIKSICADFEKTENSQLDGFAAFAAMKSNADISASDLNKTIYEMRDKISLDTVYEYLMQTKQRTDIYSDGPIVDVLLTMFQQNHPDTMVIVLGNHLAKRLVAVLNELLVIENIYDIPDAQAWLAQKAVEAS